MSIHGCRRGSSTSCRRSASNLLVALVPLAGWGLEHQRDVDNAREHFDRLQRWRSQGEEITARSASTPRIV